MEDGLEQRVREEFDRHIPTNVPQRHRAIVESYRDFVVLVLTGNCADLESLLAPDAEVHHYGPEPELRLKGSKVIADFYAAASGAVTTLDWKLEHLVVGDAGLAGLIDESALTSASFLEAANMTISGGHRDPDEQVRVRVKIAFFWKCEGDLASEYVVVPTRLTIEPGATA